jgi:uncharacterized protein (DUF1330 family)
MEELMTRYAPFAVPTLMQYGGEMIAGTPAPKVLEGSFDATWSAILRFPSLEMADAWYNSPEYAPLKELRINELSEGVAQLLLLEGM